MICSMFCCKCGSQSVTEANFCHNCGYSFTLTTERAAGSAPATTTTTTSSSSTDSTGNKTVSFEDFMRRKEHDRQSRFEPKSKKLKLNKSKCKGKEKESEVSINIGYMKLDNDGNLKKCRGKMLPIRVLPSAGKSEILEKAVQKHANHDKNIQGGLQHVLLNGDGNEITTLPGTDKDFVLREYKEDVGRHYNRITLFVALKSSYMFSEISSLKTYAADSESDSEIVETGAKKDAVDTSATCSKNPYEAEAPIQLSVNIPSHVIAIDQDQRSSATSSQNVIEDICNKQLLECPTCPKYFSIDTIAEHADACCDIWVGEVQPELANSDASDTPPATPPQLPLPDDSKDVKDIILNITKSLPNKIVRLHIRRKYMWSDFKEARLKGKVTPSDQVKIVFIGEPAIDDGGPKREFFSEMLEHVERKLFSNRKPIDSTLCLSNGDFRFAGEIIAMSILQGGPAPSFISKDVYSYMTKQLLTTETMSPSKYKEVAVQINNACDNEKLRDILVEDDVFEVLADIGYTGVPNRETLETASNIVQSICIKGHFLTSLPQLMELEEGLKSCGVFTSMRENTKLWESVFVPDQSAFTLTPDEFLDEISAKFSCSQAYKDKEIDVFKLFCDYTQSLDSEGDVTISDLVKWMSGSKFIPVLGFPKQFSFSFVHGCRVNCKCRPTTSTCELLVKMPVHINNLGEMVEVVTSALKDCVGFGCI